MAMRRTIARLSSWWEDYVLLTHNRRVLRAIAEREAVKYTVNQIRVEISDPIELPVPHKRYLRGLFFAFKRANNDINGETNEG